MNGEHARVIISNQQSAISNLPPEFRFIIDLVEPGSHVIDLGCGTGDLLKALVDEKQVRAQGIELSEDAIQSCIAKGLFVYHGDLDEGLADFNDQSVDYVIATNTLQVLHRPAFLIQEMARVGKRCIISVPNFAYFRIRWQLFFKGVMPKTGRLPYEWYDSPNIHLTTVKDFRAFCRGNGIRILREIALRTRPDGSCAVVRLHPNFFADCAVFMISNEQ